ncbi:hypothetical protein B7463_g12223, partial [Scytalidium lignicola]
MFKILLWADLAQYRIDDLCAESPESIQLHNWMALKGLKSHLLEEVRNLFYPQACTDDIPTDPGDFRQQPRRDRFLAMLDQSQYYKAYRSVLEHLEETFLDIEKMLNAGHTERQIISSIMSHVVQWINSKPKEVFGRKPNKLQLPAPGATALASNFQSAAGPASRTERDSKGQGEWGFLPRPVQTVRAGTEGAKGEDSASVAALQGRAILPEEMSMSPVSSGRALSVIPGPRPIEDVEMQHKPPIDITENTCADSDMKNSTVVLIRTDLSSMFAVDEKEIKPRYKALNVKRRQARMDAKANPGALEMTCPTITKHVGREYLHSSPEKGTWAS